MDRGREPPGCSGTTNSRWRDVLTDADVELYQRKIKAELTPGLIRWLTDGRLLAGDPGISCD